MKRPSNGEIAAILGEVGEYLSMDDVPFKPRAYERVAEVIAGLDEEVRDLYAKGGLKALEALPGVGRSIAEHIEELVTTGKLRYHTQLKRQVPVNLTELKRIEGLGVKSIKKLYRSLGVKTIADLEKAAKKGKVRDLEGFGVKSEENIIKGIAFVRTFAGRFVLGFAMPEIRAIEEQLRRVKGVKKLVVAGSVRRWKETIKDADILIVSSRPRHVMDYFIAMPEVLNVHAHGETKSSVKLRSGLNVDLRVVPEESYGAALAYFTGSKDHNVAMRKIAIKHRWKLNEYGLFGRRGRMIAGNTEEEIYAKLGMSYVEPELRENTGEIAAALRQAQGKQPGLPRVIGYGDLRGDLQVQTSWTDGSDSIETMAREATRRGLSYVAITDHTKRLAMTGGLDDKKVLQQVKEIDRVNAKFKKAGVKMTVFSGTECDILKDGSLDLKDETLAKLDVVGVSVHSHFSLPSTEQTQRIIRAMENPHVDIIFHPTGRVINRRGAYGVDIGELIAAAKRTGTVLEIDAYPDRLDLKDEYIKQCVEVGVPMVIDSDAHTPAHFSVLEYGIAQARRGWATRRDILNTQSVERVRAFFRKPKKQRG